MDYIIRPKYIKKIEKFIDKPVIKILTGMRRVGKSTILEIIKDELLKEIPSEHKIHLNFESSKLFAIHDAKSLMEYLKPIIEQTDNKLYFFFDEIQLISSWEKAVNALRVDLDCDIYITGSNSTLISGDLATLLAGRYVEFDIQPFTFSEFIKIFETKEVSKEVLFDKYITKEVLFDKYIKIGGMPFLKYFEMEEEVSYKYLSDVYNTVIVKDVLEYNKIRDVDVFTRILSYAIENIGHTFSANSIKNYFKSENRKVSVDTILNYLNYCTEAFILKKVKRFDTVGKRLLKVEEKYYLADHGFRNAKGFSNTKDIERVLENIVYIELLSRGFDVRIGKVGEREIDFIGSKDGQISYYQVSYMMPDEKTREREFGVFDAINDNYPKYVLSMDSLDFSQNGIIHQNIVDFLLDVEM